ncbi:MAG: peptidase C1 [Ignavibacteriales bacterium]|nr:peptidase C1 [Ignavibacteriales bacterium]
MRLLLSVLILFAASFAWAQPDKAVFKKHENPFYEQIEERADEYLEEEEDSNLVFKVDFENVAVPSSPDDFTSVWRADPVSQGRTGTCWAFATTSYLESEAKRLHGTETKLSEMYFVYWEYVEKAREFVRTRGESRFAEGSLSDAVLRVYKKYGAMPRAAYDGLLPAQPFYDHSKKMFPELETYLDGVKRANAWNERAVVETVRAILDKYMTAPPDEFAFEGETYTPRSFAEDHLKLDADDYVSVISSLAHPADEYARYKQIDNWRKSEDYYNATFEEFVETIRQAIRDGNTVCLDGDVSEAGLDGEFSAAVIPSYDIPSEFIDANARQFRIENKSSKDDHLVHLVGYTENEAGEWFLIKDSMSSAFNGEWKGYYFYHLDYVKLKTLCFVVHRDAAAKTIADFR